MEVITKILLILAGIAIVIITKIRTECLTDTYGDGEENGKDDKEILGITLISAFAVALYHTLELLGYGSIWFSIPKMIAVGILLITGTIAIFKVIKEIKGYCRNSEEKHEDDK